MSRLVHTLLQTIYPLIVFILVALDKLHHSQGMPMSLRTSEWYKRRGPTVTVTFDIDVERSTATDPNFAQPMEARTLDCHPSPEKNTYALVSESRRDLVE